MNSSMRAPRESSLLCPQLGLAHALEPPAERLEMTCEYVIISKYLFVRAAGPLATTGEVLSEVCKTNTGMRRAIETDSSRMSVNAAWKNNKEHRS